MIKDSGERRQFETGAVRDIQEGKGRCDLLPLDVVGEIYMTMYPEEPDIGMILKNIYQFVSTNKTMYLMIALDKFSHYNSWGEMFLEVSKHFEEGSKKYGEHNWQKGIPTHCYIDSAVRHYLKYLRGDDDEPHDRAFVWNILCCIWTCLHKPEMNDYDKNSFKDCTHCRHLIACPGGKMALNTEHNPCKEFEEKREELETGSR